MSAVQPCLETNEMSKTNELLSSFETIDEDKDSDEESFHLFLEGDEDITKENTEEKESNNSNSIPEESNDNESLEKQNQAVTEETENSNISEDITSSNKDTSEENQTNITQEIDPVKEIETKNNLPENSSCESTSNTENSTKNVSKTEETDSKIIPDGVEADPSSENEDDILNKHVSSEELSNNVEELDPNIEESLLNECDEIESEENSEKCGENGPDTNSVATSEVNKTEEIESVVKEKSNETVEHKSAISENGNENVDGDKDSEKNIVSATDSQKCDDNSNSSSPDTDDLLDISMIKDSAQDDADIAEDALQLEQENHDSSSKGNENADNVDDSSNSGNSDEEAKEESETSENVQTELSDSEKEKDAQESDKVEAINKTDESQCENIKENGDNAGIVDSVSSENFEQQTEQTPKRNLSSSDSEPSSKRIKLVEDADTNSDDAEMDSGDITELQNLISFSQFMTKSHLKKLTRADLEEFCIQKLCEAILHKSELGETNHQLKILEQTIESLRRDQAVVTKQIKDLEIVNKKLMHEILSANGTKPILPVKITRSVGLQVRLPLATDLNAAKRRSLPPAQQKTPVVQNQSSTPKIRTPAINTPNRSLTQPSPQKQTTPILTQALQNRNRTPVKTPQPHNNTTQRPSISPKPVPEKRARTSGSFIDLTDEDDKKANSKNLKSIVPQGVRINSVPKTTSVSSVMPSVVSSGTSQLMYVVQQNSQIKQGVLATHGQKAVLVNFQPTNGILNSLNSSSVSVIPKVSANAPIKTKPTLQNSMLKLTKHPAPLPSPPAIQGPNDKNLKSIPPKPVLSIRKTNTGIILQWRMPYDLGNYESIASYQLYAYQETSAVPSTDMWRKVGDVKAMALPMACTLTQFADKNKYYFAVRPVDIHKRIGKFSHPVLSE